MVESEHPTEFNELEQKIKRVVEKTRKDAGELLAEGEWGAFFSVLVNNLAWELY